jgi:hypothetical protein
MNLFPFTFTQKRYPSSFALGFLLVLISSGCSKPPFSLVFTQDYKRELDCGFVQNVYGERISWKNNTPISFHIHESLPSRYHNSIEAAMEKWNQVTGRPLFKLLSKNYAGDVKPRQDGVNVIYWMTTWESNKKLEQGRTSIYWVGNQIREADIRINASNFSFYLDTARTPVDVHFESLILHELGHVLGLKHIDEADSVMATYLLHNTKRVEVSALDTSSLNCEYGRP